MFAEKLPESGAVNLIKLAEGNWQYICVLEGLERPKTFYKRYFGDKSYKFSQDIEIIFDDYWALSFYNPEQSYIQIFTLYNGYIRPPSGSSKCYQRKIGGFSIKNKQFVIETIKNDS